LSKNQERTSSSKMEILAEDTLRPRISICKEKWGAAGSQTLAFAPPCDPTYSDGIATNPELIGVPKKLTRAPLSLIRFRIIVTTPSGSSID
jgi:hypothetical protein